MSQKISLFAAFVCLYACTFAPTEEVYEHVKKPTQRITQIELFNSNDTLMMRGNVSLFLGAETVDEIKKFTLSIGNTTVQTAEGAPRHVDIDTKKFPDGVYDLTLTIVKIPGDAESLSALLGLETYDQNFSRKIWIYNAPTPAPIVTTRAENGVLVAEWQQYLGAGFVKFTVSSNALPADIVITDPKAHSISLPNFSGGQVWVSVHLTTSFDFQTGSTSHEYHQNAAIEKNTEGFLITWNPSIFSSCSGTRLVFVKEGVDQVINLDPSITEYQYNTTLVFPYDLKISAYTTGSNNQIFLFKESTYSSELRVNTFVPGFAREVKYYPNLAIDTLIVGHFHASENEDQQGYLSLLNSVTGEELSLIQGRVSISPNGQFLLQYNENEIAIIDPDNFYTETFTISNIIATTGTLKNIFVSDGNKVLFYYQEGDEEKYYVVDWVTKTLLFSGTTFESRPLTRYGTLTNDGGKFYKNIEIVKIDVMPNEITHLEPDQYHEVGLSNVDKSIRWVDELYLVEDKNYSPYDGLYINYDKEIIEIFGNRDNQIGVAYIESGKIKVDIFELGGLKLLSTLETSFDVNKRYSLNFTLSQKKLIAYEIENTSLRPTAYIIDLDF